jgi:hypothetical protein
MPKKAVKRKAPGRPATNAAKQSVTARFDPGQLEQLDAMATASGINRSGLLQIAAKALLKTGLAATMKVLE